VETLTTKMGTDEGCRSRKIKWKINFPDFSASLLFFFLFYYYFFEGGLLTTSIARASCVSPNAERALERKTIGIQARPSVPVWSIHVFFNPLAWRRRRTLKGNIRNERDIIRSYTNNKFLCTKKNLNLGEKKKLLHFLR
jgi:hypothetical protein